MRLKRILIKCFTIALLLALFAGVSTLSGNKAQAASQAVSPEEAPMVSDIRIEILDDPDRKGDLTALARNIILFREKDVFSDETLDASLDALKLLKLFGRIDVETRKQDQRVSLLFRLTPYRRIKDVRIHGKYPFFKKEILSVLAVHPGAVYVPEEMDEQARLLTDFYREQGFKAPSITVTPREDPGTGNVRIDIDIDRGPFFRVEDITFTGNRAFSDGTLNRRMKTRKRSLLPWRSGRFVEKRLQKDIQLLTAFYRSRKYPEATIAAEASTDPETLSVRVSVTVNEGPRYRIRFDGNKALGNRTLRKTLTLFKEGNQNDRELRQCVRKMKTRYRQAGYLNAQIDIDENIDTEKNKHIRHLTFVVREGPRSTVESVRISGNESLSTADIQKQLRTRVPGFMKSGIYVPEILEEDLDAVKALYLKHGFPETEVTAAKQWTADKHNVAIHIEIIEGVRTRVDAVEISNLTAVPENVAEDAVRLKKGSPFRLYMIKSDENALSALISEKGYPHVRVKGETVFTPDRSGVRITYRVDEGPYVETGHIFVGGNLRTRPKILFNEMPLKTGAPFSLKQRVESQRNIRNLNCIDDARFKTMGLKEKTDRATLVIDVEEKAPYYLEAGAGYESQKEFYANARAGDRNLLGTNKDAWISGEINSTGYRWDLGLLEPRLWGTRISSTLNLFAQESEEFNQDFGTRSYGAALGLKRKWRNHFAAGLSFRYENREQFPLGSVPPLFSIEHEPRGIFVASPFVRYDNRDSAIRPKKGILSNLNVDISNGIDNQLDDFIRFFYDLRSFTTPLDWLTLAGIGRVGYLSPYNSAGVVSQDQLFYLGGISDVRGYAENRFRFDSNGNALGGRLAISGSIETRFDLGKGIELVGFFDAGYMDKTQIPIGSDDVRFTAGSGLRYITPIGPVGVLYGHKLNRVQGESAGQWYFSIGYSF